MATKIGKKEFEKVKFLYDSPIPLTDDPLPKTKSLLKKAIHLHKNSLAEINLYIRLVDILKEIPQTRSFERLSGYARKDVFREEIAPRLEYIRLRLMDAQELCFMSLLEYAGVSGEIRDIASMKLMKHINSGGDLSVMKLLHRHRVLPACMIDASDAPTLRNEIRKAVRKNKKN